MAACLEVDGPMIDKWCRFSRTFAPRRQAGGREPTSIWLPFANEATRHCEQAAGCQGRILAVDQRPTLSALPAVNRWPTAPPLIGADGVAGVH
jgi:hypothetical protein